MGYRKSKNAKQSVVTIGQSGLNMQAVPLIGKKFSEPPNILPARGTGQYKFHLGDLSNP